MKISRIITSVLTLPVVFGSIFMLNEKLGIMDKIPQWGAIILIMYISITVVLGFVWLQWLFITPRQQEYDGKSAWIPIERLINVAWLCPLGLIIYLIYVRILLTINKQKNWGYTRTFLLSATFFEDNLKPSGYPRNGIIIYGAKGLGYIDPAALNMYKRLIGATLNSPKLVGENKGEYNQC